MTNIQGPPPDANLPPVGGTPGQSGQTPGQASGQGDPEVQDGTEMIKKVFKGGGKGTTGTAQEGETPLQDIDEFGKMAGEVGPTRGCRPRVRPVRAADLRSLQGL